MLINDLIELGELVRRRRTELDLSQSELAEKVGATRQWISRLENGKHDISTARLFAVLDALEMNLDIRPPRANASINVSLPDIQSMIPAAALKAIREMPMPQFSVPDLSGLKLVTHPNLTTNVEQILKSGVFSGGTPPYRKPLAELAAAEAVAQPTEAEPAEAEPDAAAAEPTEAEPEAVAEPTEAATAEPTAAEADATPPTDGDREADHESAAVHRHDDDNEHEHEHEHDESEHPHAQS